MKKSISIFMSTLLIITLFTGCWKKSTLSQDGNTNQVSTKASPDHFDTIIGHVINGDFVLVANIDKKIADWEKTINNGSSLNVAFNNVFIEINDGKYFLTGVDESIHATSRIELILSSGKFYEAKFNAGTSKSSGVGISCTCSGCKSTGPNSAGECSPKQNEDGWYCTDCSKGDCVKTETFESNGIVSQ